MTDVLAHDCLLLLCWGRQEPGSGSALVWIPERMEESGLEGLSWLRLWGGTWHVLSAFTERPPLLSREPFPSSLPHHET